VIVNRQHPILSPLAFLSAVLLMAGVGVSLWLTGGAAFSPGELSAAGEPGTALGGFETHSDFEHDCNQCHVPIQGVTDNRCERCHLDVAEQVRRSQGLHSAMGIQLGCAGCHPEHEGRAFDVAAHGLEHFDHVKTGFALTLHIQDFRGAVIECRACHAGTDFDFAVAGCVGCHAEEDRAFMLDHVAAFGDGCLSCHDGADRMRDFDHNTTALALEGAHAAADCNACHTAEEPPASQPAQCAACHQEPPVHAGAFGADCADCHDANGWTPARLAGQPFTHAATGFALDTHPVDFAGQAFTCQGCHINATSDPASLKVGTNAACTACHTTAAPDFMTGHVQTFGMDCAGCHDGTGNMANFDHALVFVLDGAHAPLACADCHVEQQFQGTPAECAGCHAEPELHAGVFGLECGSCHTTEAWLPAALRAHTFPLDHGEEGIVACATCHTESYAEYTCYECHEHAPQDIAEEHREEGITAAELTECAACHPTGREE
jgi:hypothetical protein